LSGATRSRRKTSITGPALNTRVARKAAAKAKSGIRPSNAITVEPSPQAPKPTGTVRISGSSTSAPT
jgi:hypothetical protein